MKLHPITEKCLKKGHPWITRDKFSVNLPKRPMISLAPYGHFLTDFEHPRVIARLWGKGPFSDWKKRFFKAVEKRNIRDRDNFYLVFAESDDLPGLYIQRLGDVALVQTQMSIWETNLKEIVSELKELGFKSIWFQKREGRKAPKLIWGEKFNPIIEEFNLKFQLKFDLNHDMGLFTDMAQIRKELVPFFIPGKTMLNLFSYTGAFSLMGVKKGLTVTSVDQSKTYTSWHKKNEELNNFKSSIIRGSVLDYLKDSKTFDLIICDPPTLFTHHKKRIPVLSFYKTYFDDLCRKVSKSGTLVVFVNTHNLPWKKFLDFFTKITPKNFKVVQTLSLSNDCAVKENFPEGNYLKGLVLKRSF